MTSSDDNQDPSPSKSLDQKALPEGLGTLEEQLSFKNKLRRLEEKIDKVAKAAQTNDELLVDGVRNLEMRLNMVMAVLDDVVKNDVKFVGREKLQPGEVLPAADREIDMGYYFDEYMKKEESQSAAAQAVTTPDKPQEFPEDAVIFGDKS